jgi:hypothetical protein
MTIYMILGISNVLLELAQCEVRPVLSIFTTTKVSLASTV